MSTSQFALDRFASPAYSPTRTAFSAGFGERMARRFRIPLFAMLVAALSAGCVERRFRVESNPPGAYVYVNNNPVGATPVDVPFLYYGDYDITIVKEGFQTQRVQQPVSTPWYQYPIVDFFSESLWPGQITDNRTFLYELEPVVQPSLDLLKAEGEELRGRAAQLPAPRYPDPRKDTPVDQPIKRGEPPATLPVPKEPIPPPRQLPGSPEPKPLAPGL
jgi:hypothetical protein